MDHRAVLPKIAAPTLVIAGAHDVATTPATAREFVRDRVPGAKLIVLDAAHISNIEQADKYTAAALEFFSA